MFSNSRRCRELTAGAVATVVAALVATLVIVPSAALAQGTTSRDSMAIRDASLDYISWVDYLQLGKVDGRWVIINVLWEMRAGR